ncbi:MAG: MlaD family protein [Gammaproteobacteria bacterium]|nr:MlaD family protein [Gammaproteobacteria bacterium]
MYERTNYLAVGVFILLGTVVLLVVGFWVAEVGQTVPTTRYTVIFERNVNGLSEGSPVRYMGVDVGLITTIQLSRAEDKAIEVEIEVASSTPIDSGTYASLAYQGITGVAFINLAADPGEHVQLAVRAGQAYPIIRTRDVGIAALLSSGPGVLARVDTILDAAGLLLGEGNRSSATQILQNLEQVTGALAEERDALAGIPVRLNESLDKLQDTLDLAADITSEARPDLLAAMQNLRHTADNLANATGRLEQWLAENDAAVDSFLSGGVGETAALVTDTRAAIRELEKLVAKLQSNPSYLIYKPKLDPVAVPE